MPKGQVPRRPARAASRRSPEAALDLDHLTTLREMLAPAELDGLLERGEAQLAGVAAGLQAACERGDRAEMGREAHKLAGLAGSIGCSTLLAAACEIEAHAARNAGLKKAQATVHGLARLLPATVAALRQWRAAALALPSQP